MLAAQHDIELKTQRELRLSQIQSEIRNHALPRFIVGQALINRIKGQQRITGEIHLCHKPRCKRLAEK